MGERIASRGRGPAMALAAAMMLTGCGGAGDPSKPEAQTEISPPAPAISSTAEASEPLVGTWGRVTRCKELVSALKRAGLEKWVREFVAGNAFVPGVTSGDQIADLADPCQGAVPREHSHFFTPDGEFGSLDWAGEQVDDGTYKIIDDHTFVVSKEFPDVTFNYSIEGDKIMFEPLLPDCAPGCFEAAWSVSVAYPGKTWELLD